ncbi:hypothetical protein DM503_04780 [Salmonella enterica]|nr:hypothetical protein [Salmonella enterica subsp. enterica serovar Bredeney]EGX5975698.1 hypothetical protein [Salmonella enterica]
MNIEFHDHGATATIIINSLFWEFGRHCRVVDAALFAAPGSRYQMKGGIFMKTVINGKTVPLLRALKVAKQEAAR